MKKKHHKKILILDGISGVSLAKDISESIISAGINCEYIDCAQLKIKKFYKPRQAVNKIIQKSCFAQEFYYTPKIPSQIFAQAIEASQANIVFVVGFLYRFIDIEYIIHLKEKQGFSLYLYDTDSCNLFSRRRELLYFINQEFPIYDRVFSFSSVMANFSNKLNKTEAYYFPFGSKDIPPPTNKQKEHDVFFIGSADLRRIFLLEKLTKHNTVIYGSRWGKNWSVISSQLQKKIIEKNLWGKELHQHLHQSKIILNITRSGFYGVETGLNLRIFETLAAGAFLLTDYCDELADLFTIGQHIEAFNSSEEMIDKVDYYLKNSDKREKIARNGLRLFHEKFSWDKRVAELLPLL